MTKIDVNNFKHQNVSIRNIYWYYEYAMDVSDCWAYTCNIQTLLGTIVLSCIEHRVYSRMKENKTHCTIVQMRRRMRVKSCSKNVIGGACDGGIPGYRYRFDDIPVQTRPLQTYPILIRRL